MPAFSTHHASKIAKLLLLGHPGTGKTGALASLANEGYLLRILDFDNGLDILHQYVEEDMIKNISYVTCTDKMKIIEATTGDMAGRAIPLGEPTAWVTASRHLSNWKNKDEDLGKVLDWDDSVVLVIDSLTLMGAAAMHFVKHVNGALLERDWGFYGPAMDLQEKMLMMLHSDAVKCNVIVMAHIVPNAPQKRVEIVNPRTGKKSIQFIDASDPVPMPSALGNKLPPKVGRFFNAVLEARVVGTQRLIQTTTISDLNLKNPAPKNVPAQLPLSTGLADYFRAVKSTATHSAT